MNASLSSPSRFGSAPTYPAAAVDPTRVKTTLFEGDPHHGGNGSGRGPLATFLGLFSIGLGIWEIARPRGVAHRTGVRHPALLRAYGAREITAGVGILTDEERTGFWLWSRVAGDAVDLATIAAAYAHGSADDRRKNLEAAAAVAGVTALDILCACEHSRL